MSARTVLLAGNDAGYLRMLAYELTRAGFTVADDSAAPDCALVDLDSAAPPPGLPAIGYTRNASPNTASCARVLTRPFAIPILLDALRGLGSPDPQQVNRTQQIVLGDAHTVTHCGRSLTLMPAEYAVLACLLRAGGEPVSRAALIAAMPSGSTPTSNLAEVTVCALRRKLETAFGLRAIRTVRGVGYRWEEQA